MDEAKWVATLKGAEFEETPAKTLGGLLASADMDMTALKLADKDTLKEIGIKSVGHQLRILALASDSAKPTVTVKLPTAKPPQLTMDMTAQSFRKFTTDWKVFCDLTALPENQKHSVIYSNAEEAVQEKAVAVPGHQVSA